MHRPTPILERHLLTRSDLAAMQVLATEVFRWLSDGSLEQIGKLPSADGRGDPVFTVLVASLRSELTERLAAIGKPTVVLTPLGVRSFLLRALLRERNSAADAGSAAPDTRSDPVDETALENLSETDLAAVLEDASAELITDGEMVMQLASDTAEAEAKAEATEAPRPTPPADDPEHDDGHLFEASTETRFEFADEEPRGAANTTDEECFDFADLANELDQYEESPADGRRSQPRAAATVDEAAASGAATFPDDGQMIAEPTGTLPPAEHASEPAAEPLAAAESLQDRSDSATEILPQQVIASDPTSADPTTPTESEDDLGKSPGIEGGDAAAQIARDFEKPSEPARMIAPAAVQQPPLADDFALTNGALDRVQDFLGELKHALVELAQRPPASAIDIEPLVKVVQVGFERSAEQVSQTSTALASLTERMQQFGERIGDSVHENLQAVRGQRSSAVAPVAVVNPNTPHFVASRPDRQTLVIGAVALLVICWSILFWVKTGSPRLALGTLVAANLVGCSLLLARRQRG